VSVRHLPQPAPALHGSQVDRLDLPRLRAQLVALVCAGAAPWFGNLLDPFTNERQAQERAERHDDFQHLASGRTEH